MHLHPLKSYGAIRLFPEKGTLVTKMIVVWCVTPYCVGEVIMFRRRLLPPSSGSKDGKLSGIVTFLRVFLPRNIPGAVVFLDSLCGLMVRVPGYRSRGPSYTPGTTRFSE
jgi:hypothetical protein